jgi:hypothetical protein
MPTVQKVFRWDQGRKQVFLIPAGVFTLTVRGCGGGGGGASGDASAGSQNPGYAGGGGAGSLLQTIAYQGSVQLTVNPGIDTITVMLGAGGAGAVSPDGADGFPGGNTTIVLSNLLYSFALYGAQGGNKHGARTYGNGTTISAGEGQNRAGPWFQDARPNNNYGYCGGSGGAGYGGPGFPGGSGGCDGGSLGPYVPGHYWMVHAGFPGLGWGPGMTNWGAGGGGGGGGGDGNDHIHGGDGGNGAPGFVELIW